jgi:hypothetical protein
MGLLLYHVAGVDWWDVDRKQAKASLLHIGDLAYVL